MIVITFVVAFVVTFVVSLPNDWARRQSTEAVTAATTILNVAGVAGVVLICVKTGLVPDAISVVVLIVGIALAGVAGNLVGTRIWGQARQQ